MSREFRIFGESAPKRVNVVTPCAKIPGAPEQGIGTEFLRESRELLEISDRARRALQFPLIPHGQLRTPAPPTSIAGRPFGHA
jgi:hypothetical protein